MIFRLMRNGNESIGYVFLIVFLAALLLAVMSWFYPARAKADTIAQLTPSQVSAIVGLLEAFGVDQNTIAIVETDLEPASTTPVAAQTTETVAPVSTTTSVAPTPSQAVQNVTQTFSVAAAPQPPKVPVCDVSAIVVPHGLLWEVYFSWDADPASSAVLSGYGVLPSYTSHVTHPPTVTAMESTTTVYTLTETMTDPAYQTTTTCQVTAVAAQ